MTCTIKELESIMEHTGRANGRLMYMKAVLELVVNHHDDMTKAQVIQNIKGLVTAVGYVTIELDLLVDTITK